MAHLANEKPFTLAQYEKLTASVTVPKGGSKKFIWDPQTGKCSEYFSFMAKNEWVGFPVWLAAVKVILTRDYGMPIALAVRMSRKPLMEKVYSNGWTLLHCWEEKEGWQVKWGHEETGHMYTTWYDFCLYDADAVP